MPQLHPQVAHVPSRGLRGSSRDRRQTSLEGREADAHDRTGVDWGTIYLQSGTDSSGSQRLALE